MSPGESYDLQSNPDEVDRHVDRRLKAAQEGEWASLPGNGADGMLFATCKDGIRRADDPYLDWCIGTPGTNCAKLYTDSEGTTDPRMVAYDTMRTNVLAVGTAFAADWCEAGPTDLTRYLDLEPYVRPPITLAWMLWLSPAYARLMTPPPPYANIVTERLTDGSLFMATGTKTFDLNHSPDLSQARAIHRQVDHLNYTVPFNGEYGRSDRVPPFPKV